MQLLKKPIMKFFAVVMAVSLIICSSVTVSAASYSTSHPNTWVNTGNQVEDLIGVAMTQVGYWGTEYGTGTKYGAWYGMTYEAWCGMFVSWCANQAGIPQSVIKPSARANAFAYTGTYHYKDGYTPKRGDLVLYNPNDGYGYYFPSKNDAGIYVKSQHVAIVCSYNAQNGTIQIVHGNATDDKVCYDTVSVSSNCIQAFVTPPYTSGGSSDSSVGSVASDYVNDVSNLRAAPGTSSQKLTVLQTGTQVKVLETVTDSEGDKWYHVQVPSLGITGYIFAELVTVVTPSSTSDSINGSDVRLRAGAGTGTEILTVLQMGQVVTVLGEENDAQGDLWYKVSLVKDGVEYTGYVFGEYVNLAQESETETPSKVNSVNADSTRLREGYGYDKKVLTYLSKGQVVTILDTVTDADGDNWYHITCNVSGTDYTGYVLSELISVEVPTQTTFKYNLEYPSNSQEYIINLGSELTLGGWAFSENENTVCYASVDGSELIPLNMWERSDVKNVYPQCNVEKCGFNGSIDISGLSEGEHTLTVIASSGTVISTLTTRNFTVKSYDPSVVSFDNNGGNGDIESIEKQYSVPVIIGKNVPTRDGYYFAGWSLSSNADTVDYIPGDTYEIDSDTVLYAVWTSLDGISAGDANGDGAINTTDLAVVKKLLAATDWVCVANGDADGDGKVDTTDLAVIKKHLAGVI